MNTENPKLLITFVTLFLVACSSGGSNTVITTPQESNDELTDVVTDEPTDSSDESNLIAVDGNSLATIGCQNVVIIDTFAYAACGNGIEIVNLNSLERSFLPQPADDISGDAELGLIFTQSGNTLQQFDLANPMQPNLINTANTNFALSSGVSSANGILVISAGSTDSDTQVYTYDNTTLSLAIAGIPEVDGRTGNPDVHVAAAPDGAIAFYSQDLGFVANWGIQIVEFDITATITDVPDVVVLTPGQFTGSFGFPIGPANFPLQSEFLDDRLYIAHFAANGIQIIDRLEDNAISLIPLGYEPTNITSDGIELVVVAVNRNIVDIINPITETVVNSISLPLQQPTGIAASSTHIAVADRTAGLIIATR